MVGIILFTHPNGTVNLYIVNNGTARTAIEFCEAGKDADHKEPYCMYPPEEGAEVSKTTHAQWRPFEIESAIKRYNEGTTSNGDVVQDGGKKLLEQQQRKESIQRASDAQLADKIVRVQDAVTRQRIAAGQHAQFDYEIPDRRSRSVGVLRESLTKQIDQLSRTVAELYTELGKWNN